MELGLGLLLISIGLITFAMRYSSIGLSGRAEMPLIVRRALRYVPPAVLSAIFVPELFQPGGTWNLSLSNVRLLAGLLAILVAWRSRNIILTIAVGMVALWLLSARLGL